MKKVVLYDHRAEKEMRIFREDIQEDIRAMIEILGEKGKLEFPEARKVTREIFEIRVTREGIYRGFYAYIQNDRIIILHFFQKKQQKIPQKHIHLAEQRLNDYV